MNIVFKRPVETSKPSRPTLTKHHFEEFAFILGSSETKEEIERKILIYFNRSNPRFDEERFKEAVEKHREETR